MNFPILSLATRRGHARGRTAFSLVEVALSLGILSFALVGLMGMLPVGLSTFHRSTDNSTGAQIAQRLINEAGQTDFSTLIGSVATNPVVRYFDNQGNELADANKSRAVFTTRLVVTSGAAGTTLPGAVSASNAGLATLVVQVAVNPGNRGLTAGNNQLWTAVPGVTISNYAANVARNDASNAASNG